MKDKLSVFDRRTEILSRLFWEKIITMRELAIEFDVSEDTIGRDIVYLSRCFVFTRKECLLLLLNSFFASWFKLLESAVHCFVPVLCSFSICLVHQLLRKGY